ncbi:MAG: hypothetical protein HN377_09260 [Alphaproteobacteria bacterium]|nr:hypothetical protein [Alphaproteobacteria bacterium]
MVRFCVGLLVVLLVAPALVSSTSARQWESTPAALAQDYVQIIHQRAKNEVVVFFWIAPPIIPASKDSGAAKKLLDDHIVLGVIHADIDNLGQMKFRKVSRLNLKSLGGETKQPLDKANLPPVVAGTLITLQRVFAQSLGALGRGANWFIFDGKWNPSCGKGGFVVPYLGVNYDYLTPIPGC